LNETQLFWVTGIALFLDVQYAIHDQAVFGLNTGITLLSWLGIYLWQQRRDVWGGLSLGAAIAIKCTPAIFLGYFIWKRQWRMAMCTTMAALLFTVLPIVRQGPALWTAHMQSWVRTVGAGLAGTGFEHNEDFQDKNMALRPVLLRYLTHLPDIGAADDPRAIRLLNLSPTAAHVLVGAVLLGLIALFLWCARGRLTSRDDSLVLWQCAALGVLMVLLSPITWGQHCVGLLPACFLISATLVVHERIPRWMMALLSVYVVCCCLAGRDLIGKRLGVLLVGYHITTFCIVGLLVIVLVASRQQESAK
jgi:hypothetical protein